MRRLLTVVLVALLGLPLLAATPNAFVIKPSVIVYPLVSTGSSVDREASSRLATLIATQMANTGQVTAVPPPPGTERKDYLSVARSHNADYYVSGFISPLGNGVSVVLQVVSTTTGIVVYSQSAQLNTYSEAAGQGDDLANFISRHANRGLAAIPTAPPQAASPSPAPSSGPGANLGKIFGRRRRATPAPKTSPSPKPAAASSATTRPAPAASAPAAALVNVTPTPSPRPTPAAPSARPTTIGRSTTATLSLPLPSTTPSAATTTVPTAATTAPRTVAAAAPSPAANAYAILGVEGTADAALREFATQRLLARTSGERVQSAATACAAHSVRAVLSGNLAVRPDAQFGGGSATFELIASDCAGKVLWRQTHSNDAGGAQGQQLATERAVDAAIGAYLNPPRRRRLL